MKKNIYSFEIVQRESTGLNTKIYKQFINFNVLDRYKNFYDNDIIINKKAFYEKRKEMENGILNNPDFVFEEILYSDDDYKEMVEDYPMKVKFLLTYALNKIQNLDYVKCLKALEDAKSMLNEPHENCMVEHVNRLLLLAEEYVMSEMEADYTILI